MMFRAACDEEQCTLSMDELSTAIADSASDSQFWHGVTIEYAE